MTPFSWTRALAALTLVLTAASCAPGPAPGDPAPAQDVQKPWYSLDHTFVMEGGEARLPKPPITGKAEGDRPKIPHLA